MWMYRLCGYVNADDLAAEMARPDDQLTRHDVVFEDFLIVVDVVDEQVQGTDTLLQARLD